MLSIWRFVFGFLTIKISGENCEQILNLAVKNGIHIWNLSYKGGFIYGNISINNFFKLYNIRHCIKCKIKIIKKHGLGFYVKKYNKRLGFLVGAVLFFVILFFMTNYVWIINIEGNDKIKTQDIITTCKKIGIYEGVKKAKINNKYDAQRLQLLQEDIAWCSFNVEGCILTINLSETEVSDKDERETPSNLKASIEGKIKKINISTGYSNVKVGDIVSKGDLLVSGVVKNMSSTSFIHSSGEVIAETKRVFSANGNFEQEIKQETNETVNRYTIKLFGKRIPLYLGNIKYNYTYNSETDSLKLFGKKIPIIISKQQYTKTKNNKVIYTDDTLIKILNDDIQKQIEKFDFITIKEQNREVIKNKNGILLKITYTCEENIAVQDNIILSNSN